MKYYHIFTSFFTIHKARWRAHYSAFHLAIADKPHIGPRHCVASSKPIRPNTLGGLRWIARELLRRRVVVPAYHCTIGPAVVLAALAGWKGRKALEWALGLPAEEKRELLRHEPIIHADTMIALKGGRQCRRKSS